MRVFHGRTGPWTTLDLINHAGGVEVVTLTDANATAEGVQTNRRKGSRDNVVGWYPQLVAADGGELRKSSLDTAWQRLIKMAIEEEVITAEQRFGLHDLKRRSITDTKGTRHAKQEASGHRSAAMMDTYDFSVPLVPHPGDD